jgi:coenzyme F420-0:L-glutamate ligase/coenzyme F420-1:gamma-L-glutamate ligase
VKRLEVLAPDGLPEVGAGTDLAAMVASAVDLRDGDVVVVTSKVVSKAEGRVVQGDREAAMAGETARVVARRGPTLIVRTRHGLVLAAAGIDASHVAPGTVLLLPVDPDASARSLRAGLLRLTGATVGVVVTDTAGRPWRDGQTDIAIGAAGIVVAQDHAGSVDSHGNTLAVTRPAVADEVAGAAELAQGKLAGRPVAVLRGRADLVLPVDDDGPGAAALVRPEQEDLFAWGAREAVVRALAGNPADRSAFGAPVPAPELVEALGHALGRTATVIEGDAVTVLVDSAREDTAARAVAFAHGWTAAATARSPGPLRLHPGAP